MQAQCASRTPHHRRATHDNSSPSHPEQQQQQQSCNIHKFTFKHTHRSGMYLYTFTAIRRKHTPAVRSTVLGSALAFLLLFAAGVDGALARDIPPAAGFLLCGLGVVPLLFFLAAFGGGAAVLPPFPKKLRIEGCQRVRGEEMEV